MSATVKALSAAVRVATVDDGDWMDRVEAMCLAPSDLAERLHELAEFADLAQQRADLVTPDGALRLIRGRLKEIAWQVMPA